MFGDEGALLTCTARLIKSLINYGGNTSLSPEIQLHTIQQDHMVIIIISHIMHNSSPRVTNAMYTEKISFFSLSIRGKCEFLRSLCNCRCFFSCFMDADMQTSQCLKVKDAYYSCKSIISPVHMQEQ